MGLIVHWQYGPPLENINQHTAGGMTEDISSSFKVKKDRGDTDETM